MVGRQVGFVQDVAGLVDTGLAARQFGLVVADRIEAALQQLGHAPVKVADGAVDALELLARVDQFRSGQAQFGKFGLQDEVGGGRFVGAKRAQALLVGRALRRRGRWHRGTGWRSIGLVGRPLEHGVKHDWSSIR